MHNPLLQNFTLIKSLEAISFIWFTIIVTLIVIVVGYIKYCQLRYEVLFQIDMFNGNIFFKDKTIFESFQEHKALQKRDFLIMIKDRRFCEHLLHKQPDYYKELVKIVQNLQLLRFYTVTAVILSAALIASSFALVVPYAQESSGELSSNLRRT
jgi:hypothetical protein